MLSNCRLVGNFYLYYIKHLWLVQEPLCPWTFNTLNITFLLSFCIRSPLTYTQHLTYIRAHTHTFPLCPSHCPPGLSVVVFLALAQCPSCKHSLTFSTSVQPPSLSHVKSTHPRLAYTRTSRSHFSRTHARFQQDLVFFSLFVVFGWWPHSKTNINTVPHWKTRICWVLDCGVLRKLK